MAAEDGLKAQKLLPRAAPWVMLAKNKVALKGQKLSISKLLPFQGDFVVFIIKPRALPWARSICPFRAYGMWLMTHPLYNVNVLWGISYMKICFTKIFLAKICRFTKIYFCDLCRFTKIFLLKLCRFTKIFAVKVWSSMSLRI